MAKTFQERLRHTTKAKSFIGREAELALLKSLLEQDEPEYLILMVHGIGGVGKTWLLNQWEELAREKKFPRARVDESQSSIEQILKKFRDDFEKQGFDFDEFDKSYQKFCQLKSEAEKALAQWEQWEDKQEQGLAKTAGRFTGKSVAVIAKLFSPSREALEFLGGSEKVEVAFAEGFGYLQKFFKSKEDLEFLKNPLQHLTQGFIDDFNRICRKKRVLLFFDTYEYLSPFCDDWLCKTFLSEELSDQIMLIFGGRHSFSACWLDYQPLARQIPLSVFTDEEARNYLSSRGVTEERTVTEILEASGRLPVYLAMLTTQAGNADQDPGSPKEMVVERFLQWIPKGESEKRRAVICCAFPRFFNKDLLQALLGTDESSEDGVQQLFNWLREQPFVSHKQQRWVYHELVREQILQYKRQESAQEFRALHVKALEFYRRQNPREESMEEELYHLLHMDADRGIHFGLAGIFQAWVEGSSWEEWANKVIEVIRQTEKENIGENQWSQLWEEQQRQILQQTSQSEGLLKRLGGDESLSAPARTGAYIHLGNLLKNQQRFAEAEQAYGKAIELNPEYATAYSNLGNLLADQQRFAEAEQAYGKAIELNPDDATAYSNLGILLKHQQRFAEAEQAYGKAIELNPEYATAYSNLGNLLADQQRFAEAEQAYGKAIELNPEYATAYSNLGNLLADQQRFAEAEQAYGKAIELNPDDATAYYNLGNLLADQQRFAEAEQAYGKAIELNPEYATAYSNLGILLADQQRFAEAEQAYGKAIELNPEYATAYSNLGILLKNQQRFAEAEQAYGKAIELNPEYATAYYNLGNLLADQQRFAEAEQAYGKAIELNPDDATAYYNLGCCYALQKDVPQAIEYLQKVIQIDPKYKDMAQSDSDFDKIREEPLFQALFNKE